MFFQKYWTKAPSNEGRNDPKNLQEINKKEKKNYKKERKKVKNKQGNDPKNCLKCIKKKKTIT